MKTPIYLLLLATLILSACAHLDNGFLRSAEPLQRGNSHGFVSPSLSYSYAPALNFEPDSTLALNSRIRQADLAFQIPGGLDIGLGKGFQIGGQLSLAPGQDFDAGFSPSLTSAFRGYLQYSLPLMDSYWLGLSPGILLHSEVSSIGPPLMELTSDKGHLLKQQGIGGEFPLTITRTYHSKDKKNSSSLTFRYSVIKVSSKINEYRSIFHANAIYDQADQNVSRYAIIYTHQLENGLIRAFMDFGIEFSDKKGLVVPVIGIKTIFNPPWQKKHKSAIEE